MQPKFLVAIAVASSATVLASSSSFGTNEVAQDSAPATATALSSEPFLVHGCWEVIATGDVKVGEIHVTPYGDGSHGWSLDGGGAGTFTAGGDIAAGNDTHGRFAVEDLDGDGYGEYATLDFEGVSPQHDGLYVLQPCGTHVDESLFMLRSSPFEEITEPRATWVDPSGTDHHTRTIDRERAAVVEHGYRARAIFATFRSRWRLRGLGTRLVICDRGSMAFASSTATRTKERRRARVVGRRRLHLARPESRVPIRTSRQRRWSD